MDSPFTDLFSMDTENSIQVYLNGEEYGKLTTLIKRRYVNIKRNYDMIKSTGFNPSFMVKREKIESDSSPIKPGEDDCEVSRQDHESECPIHGPMLSLPDRKERRGKRGHYVEGSDPSTSSWLRFANCDQQTMVAFQCEGRIFYKEVLPVWNGHQYAMALGLDLGDEPTGIENEIECCGFSSTLRRFRGAHSDIKKNSRCRTTSCRNETFAVQVGQKPHKCPHFEYRTAGTGDLKRHVITVHMGQTPHKYPYCEYRAAEKGNLKRHETGVHMGQKPHKCLHCEYRTARTGDLKRHAITVHMGQRPHKCPHCEYRAGETSTLKNHITAIHMGQKLHICSH